MTAVRKRSSEHVLAWGKYTGEKLGRAEPPKALSLYVVQNTGLSVYSGQLMHQINGSYLMRSDMKGKCLHVIEMNRQDNNKTLITWRDGLYIKECITK